MNKELKSMYNTLHAMHVLIVLCDSNLLYSEIQRKTKLKPAQLERVLKLLRKHFLIIPHAVPKKTGSILVRYELSKHGVIALECIDVVLWKI